MRVVCKFYRLKSLYDGNISQLMSFVINDIQVLQHRWTKSVTTVGTALKDEPHLVAFHEVIVCCIAMQTTTIIIQIYKYRRHEPVYFFFPTLLGDTRRET